MKVNRWKDLAERVAWTCIQAFCASVLVVGFDLEALKISGVAAGLAAAKVVVSQRVGENNDGAAIPGGVIEPR